MTSCPDHLLSGNQKTMQGALYGVERCAVAFGGCLLHKNACSVILSAVSRKAP
jgi:hypothetical protein